MGREAGMGMDWLIPSGSSDAQDVDQWYRSGLAGWARRQQAPAQAWREIHAGILAGPARSRSRATPGWAYFLDMHTWVCLLGLCVVVAGLLLSMYTTADLPYPSIGGPIPVDYADALSGRAVLLTERSQRAVWNGLSPALDPLLLHRRGAS